MKQSGFKENIILIWDKPKKTLEMAKFIICHVYYFFRYFYQDELLEFTTTDFQDYLNLFKKTFEKEEINNTFSFDLLNKFYKDSQQNKESQTNIINNNNGKEDELNEETFYILLYKQLINIIIEQDFSPEEKDKIKYLINSFISIRECFIFLEYLYSFVNNHPEKLSHYIIKINISLLLNIPKKTSKRLVNSDEFFILNLVELKGLFGEIPFEPSYFISNIEKKFKKKYLTYISNLKTLKLETLKKQLENLITYLSSKNTNKTSLLLDYIYTIYNNISKDLEGVNIDQDKLIEEYILDINKRPNKNINQLLNEINEKENNIPNFNYLYLLAINEMKHMEKQEIEYQKKEDQLNLNQKDINKNIIINDEETLVKDTTGIEEDETIIEYKNNNLKEEKLNDIVIKKEKENIIQIEELRIQTKNIFEKKISELEFEKINEEKEKNIYINFIERKYLFNKVLNLYKGNFYNILVFLNTYNSIKDPSIVNIDELYIENKNKFISSVKKLFPLDYNEFYDLISDTNFYDEIIAILKSNSITEYIHGYRYFDEMKVIKEDKSRNEYEFKFVDKNEIYVENLSKEYEKFMDKLKDSIFFTNLFRLKYLPFGIKAFVNSSLKIFFNSLYYEFNEDINKKNKKIILKAVLKIIIVHEIIHILKYLKDNISFKEIPKTPRQREGGKMLINYLFGKPYIKRINLNEAKQINNINNWNDVNLLRAIFPKESELSQNNESNKKNIDHVDLYFTGEDVEDESKKNDNRDSYIDIDIDID